ncbi:MAG: hypothetical protein PHU53_02265 [Thermoplasmata archaeon]|nr:hypothetical protein [Thermoplasmata archaeon]
MPCNGCPAACDDGGNLDTVLLVKFFKLLIQFSYDGYVTTPLG